MKLESHYMICGLEPSKSRVQRSENQTDIKDTTHMRRFNFYAFS